MKIIIGIVTYHRPEQVLRLLTQLREQVDAGVSVIVVENGSQQLTLQLVTLAFPNSKLFDQKIPSIPNARNFIFKTAKFNADYLVYLDDDVVLTKNWFSNLKKVIQQTSNPAVVALQGRVISIPQNNLYAQMSNILYSLWISKNLSQNSRLVILDTKHVVFFLKKLTTISQLFPENRPYAEDISCALMLTKKIQAKFLFCQSLVVYHRERTTWWSFTKHRFRLSYTYQQVLSDHENEIKSANLTERIVAIWQQLSVSKFQKIVCICHLLIIYSCVVVSRLMTSRLRF